MTFGSLFAGIGGFDLGFERAGMTCKWQVEIDPYANKVLAKHWPNVRRHGDVRTFPPEPAADWSVDVICGGFPCQDISYAGFGAGLDGERSGLFFEAIRVVRQLRPQFVVLENVAGLLTRGLDRVLGSLAEIGFDAEWDCLPASCFGLHHNRERVFICAYCQGAIQGVFTESRDVWQRQFQSRRLASNKACQKWPMSRFKGEPDVAPLVDGIPDWMGRYGAGKGLGNAIVPQIAEWIGNRIVQSTETP